MQKQNAGSAAGSSLYSPLEDPRRQIRLLKITGEGLSLLSMTKVNLEDVKGTYAAMSYHWGTDDILQPIVIDSQEVLVRSNLHSFLSSICGHIQRGWHSGAVNDDEAHRTNTLANHDVVRDSETTSLTGIKYFWVDALCIDQANVGERGAQVSLMGDIYRGAATVFVSLGGSEIDQAIRRFYELGSIFKFDDNITAEDAERESERLRPVITSPYWSRLWIIQEFVLARSILFVSPSYQITFTELESKWLAYMVWSKKETEQRIRHIHTIRSIIVTRNERPFGVHQALADFIFLLGIHRHARCTDPRDRVYGLLSLVTEEHSKDGGNFELEPDYNASPAQLAERLLQLVDKERYDDNGLGMTRDGNNKLARKLRDIVYGTWKWDQEWAKEVPQTLYGHSRRPRSGRIGNSYLGLSS